MGSFGERMRREREMRSITVEEIAEATKIGSRSLRALEDEKLDQLPGGIFNRGFVRAYARYLGIDEEQAVADYLAAENAYQEAHGIPIDAPERPTIKPPSNSGWVPIAGALLVLVLGFGGWRWYSGRKDRTPETPTKHAAPSLTKSVQAAAPATPPPQTQSAQATAPASAAVPSPTESSAPAPVTAGFSVKVRAKEAAWIQSSADDGPAQEASLQSAAEKTLRASKRLVLKVGNLPGVEISFNGQPLSIPASDNKVKTLTFTSAGIQQE